ncbi:MAG: hypothetical protein H7257_12195 [Taibaiella sp.]|nr:hypothetical protein [Taibaiella sp.]
MKSTFWHQILTYFYIRKRNPNDPRDINTTLMHGMNRISLFVFLVGIVVMLFRIFSRGH